MESAGTLIEVGIAELKFSSSPDVLVTRGLGSCLGIAVYEPYKKIGALAHPMLPRQENSRVRNNPAKFVDSAISSIIDGFRQKGCLPLNLVVKLFGGAHVFNFLPGDSVFNIGARNVEAAHEILSTNRMRISGEDVGGNYGRTIFFELETGKVRVKTMFYGEREL